MHWLLESAGVFPRGTSLKNQGKTENRDISNKNREADEARAENH
jgi:hypothetical protein